MKQLVGVMLAVGALAVFGGGCAQETGGSLEDLKKKKDKKEEEQPPPCRVTGGGQIAEGENLDSYGGNAQPFRWGVGGEWNHITHEEEGPYHFHGDPEWIDCDIEFNDEEPPSAGADIIEFGGPGTLDGDDECEFSVRIEDHGEPATRRDAPSIQPDQYSIEIWCTDGTTYSASGDVLHGNLQIHEVPAGHLPR